MTAREELMQWARDSVPELYRRAELEFYVDAHGEHYDEKHAREAVEAMHSTHNGQAYQGEHWTYEQVIDAMKPYVSLMSGNDTCWDAYVGLNMWWHDLGAAYERRGEPTASIIEDAMVWSFGDEDAPEGKLWKYMHAIR